MLAYTFLFVEAWKSRAEEPLYLYTAIMAGYSRQTVDTEPPKSSLLGFAMWCSWYDFEIMVCLVRSP